LKPKRTLVEMLMDLYDKYEDNEIARCVIRAKEMQDELHRTRFDRIRDWTLLVFAIGYLVHLAWEAFAK
jgi:hypothetical protein